MQAAGRLSFPSPWAQCEGVRSLSHPRGGANGQTGEGKVGAAEPPAWSGRGLRQGGWISLGSLWEDDRVDPAFGFCSGVGCLVPSLADGLGDW